MSEQGAVIYSRGEAGHRGAYIRFVNGLLGTGRTTAAGTLMNSKPVFFLMIEDSFALYVLACLWRSLLGRRTVGLLFRPGPAAEGRSLKHKTKRFILKLLKLLPTVRTLTIVPFSIAPEFSEIADGWIYDLQLWDMSVAECDDLLSGHRTELHADIAHAAAERSVIGAAGLQDRHKGFDIFANAWNGDVSLRERFLFAYGGKVAQSLDTIAADFATNGGFGLNRRVTDEELLDLYAASDAVWCLYDSTYDQASGILGRAVQFGIPAIVREGSLSHKFCVTEGAPHLAARAETLVSALSGHLPSRSPRCGAALAARFRQESFEKLVSALRLPGTGP